MTTKIGKIATVWCVSLILLVVLVGCSQSKKNDKSTKPSSPSAILTKKFSSKKETSNAHKTDSLDKEENDVYQKKAEDDINLLNKGRMNQLKKQFSDTMTNTTTDKELEQIKELINQAGRFIKVKKVSIKKTDHEYMTVTTVKYSKKELVFSINYNEDNQLNELFVK